MSIAASPRASSGADMAPSLEGNGGQVERDEKVLEEILDHADLIMQAVIAFEQVQSGMITLRESDAVLIRHNFVTPAVNHRRRTIEDARTQLGQPVQIERWSHQEHTTGVQE